MNPLMKFGIGCASFGIIGMILISVVSLVLYGQIYMYDGYAFTGTLWTICFVALGIGVFVLAFNFSLLYCKKKSKSPVSVLTSFFIVLLVIMLVLLFKACGALVGGNGSKDSTCGICGGDGIFFGEICKNCGGWGEN